MRNAHPTRGFTLTELLVAIVVLLVVIAATARIFGTVSRITAVGQATADITTEAATIQRLIQEDIARINPQGFIAIRNVEVRNGIHSGSLLNPMLPVEAKLRFDQLLFFRQGMSAMQVSKLTDDDAHKGMTTVAMVYWGHGFQFPNGLATQATTNDSRSHDLLRPLGVSVNDDLNVATLTPATILSPWYRGDAESVRTFYVTGGGSGTNAFTSTTSGNYIVTQPEVRKALLCRHQISLGDDDSQNLNTNAKTVYMEQNLMARSVFYNHPAYGGVPAFASRQIRDGRVDGAATRLNDIREVIVRWSSLPTARERWVQQRELIVGHLMRYPRAERQAPSMHRVDQALTNHVLSVACSSFRVDWTWAPGTGAATGPFNQFSGFQFGPGWNGNNPLNPESQPIEQPWFGYPNVEAAVFPVEYAYINSTPAWWVMPQTVYPGNNPVSHVTNNWNDPGSIERFRTLGSSMGEYWAVFGMNPLRPLIEDPGLSNYGNPDANLNYTPWPSAIRITMTLHDRDTNLEHGRIVQFVVPVPNRFE